jgi:hypothetical protein
MQEGPQGSKDPEHESLSNGTCRKPLSDCSAINIRVSEVMLPISDVDGNSRLYPCSGSDLRIFNKNHNGTEDLIHMNSPESTNPASV